MVLEADAVRVVPRVVVLGELEADLDMAPLRSFRVVSTETFSQRKNYFTILRSMFSFRLRLSPNTSRALV